MINCARREEFLTVFVCFLSREARSSRAVRFWRAFRRTGRACNMHFLRGKLEKIVCMWSRISYIKRKLAFWITANKKQTKKKRKRFAIIIVIVISIVICKRCYTPWTLRMVTCVEKMSSKGSLFCCIFTHKVLNLPRRKCQRKTTKKNCIEWTI